MREVRSVRAGVKVEGGVNEMARLSRTRPYDNTILLLQYEEYYATILLSLEPDDGRLRYHTTILLHYKRQLLYLEY